MKKFNFIVLILLLTVLISSCGTQVKEDKVDEVDTKGLDSEQLPSFAKCVEVIVLGTNECQITNKSNYHSIRVLRFTSDIEDVVCTLAPGDSFVDNVPYDGTSYSYSAEIEDIRVEGSKEINTLIFEQLPLFSDCVEVVVLGTNECKITNKSDEYSVQVIRAFLDLEKVICTLAPGDSFVDNVPYDGTSYSYLAEIEEIRLVGSEDVITLISEETKAKSLFYDWDEAVKEAYEHNIQEAEEIINISNKEGVAIYDTFIRGVHYSVIFDKNYVEDTDQAFLEEFFKYSAKYFSRCYELFGGYPLDEYKIIIIDNDIDRGISAYIHGYRLDYIRGEDSEVNNIHEFGIVAHEIAHAWCGNMLFNEKTDSGDGWYIEGINMFNEYLVLDRDYVVPSLGFPKKSPKERVAERIVALKHGDMQEISDEPLNITMGKYHNGLNLHYEKGCVFTYLIYDRLRNNGLSYEAYLKYTYDNYYLAEIKKSDGSIKEFTSKPFLMDSYILLESLEDFSGVSFKDLFDAYVFGHEIINVNQVNIEPIDWPY